MYIYYYHKVLTHFTQILDFYFSLFFKKFKIFLKNAKVNFLNSENKSTGHEDPSKSFLISTAPKLTVVNDVVTPRQLRWLKTIQIFQGDTVWLLITT